MKNPTNRRIFLRIGGILSILGSLASLYTFYTDNKPIENIEGAWELTFHIEESSLNRYKEGALQYTYRIRITQNRSTFKGSGEKYSEVYFGRANTYFSAERPSIKIEGKIINGMISAMITEKGTRRSTTSNFTYDLASKSGRFNSTAADSKGFVELSIEN